MRVVEIYARGGFLASVVMRPGEDWKEIATRTYAALLYPRTRSMRVWRIVPVDEHSWDLWFSVSSGEVHGEAFVSVSDQEEPAVGEPGTVEIWGPSGELMATAALQPHVYWETVAARLFAALRQPLAVQRMRTRRDLSDDNADLEDNANRVKFGIEHGAYDFEVIQKAIVRLNKPVGQAETGELDHH